MAKIKDVKIKFLKEPWSKGGGDSSLEKKLYVDNNIGDIIKLIMIPHLKTGDYTGVEEIKREIHITEGVHLGDRKKSTTRYHVRDFNADDTDENYGAYIASEMFDKSNL